jgi:hypothetical protein
VTKRYQLSVIVFFLHVCAIVSCRSYRDRKYARMNMKVELRAAYLARLPLAQTIRIHVAWSDRMIR